MKTVGEILKNARTQKNIGLEQVSQETKIHIKYLKAIEANELKKLPPSAFTKGFMRNFAKAVDINPEHILAVFRRDYDQDERGRIVPRSLSTPIKAPKNVFNPTTTTLGLSVLIGIIVVTFFIRQIMLFRSAPELTITAPPENAQLSSPVQVEGSTNPEATVKINNRPVTVEENGRFITQVPLSPGEHTLVITATSRSDRSTVRERIIFIKEDE